MQESGPCQAARAPVAELEVEAGLLDGRQGRQAGPGRVAVADRTGERIQGTSHLPGQQLGRVTLDLASRPRSWR
jgi:hypothetical protein